MLLRAGLALVAVIVVAWFGVLLRDTHYLNQGISSPRGGLSTLIAELKTSSGFGQRVHDLRNATFLTPDTTSELQIAADYQIRNAPGDLARALRIADSVAHREPQNLSAWIVIASIQRYRHDLTGQRAALVHIRQLDPPPVHGS